MELRSVTTQYVEVEDRIRLAARDGAGLTCVLWMTQRMTARLLPHLCHWMESHTGGQVNGWLLQEFAQAAATANLVPQPPVAAAGESMVVQSVDVQTGQGVQLVFKGVGPLSAARWSLDQPSLRQWLGIVRQQCQLAGWSQVVFPVWLDGTGAWQTAASSIH